MTAGVAELRRLRDSGSRTVWKPETRAASRAEFLAGGLAALERFRLGATANLEFRAEFYNLLNHTNFDLPPATLNNTLGTGTNQIQPGQPFTQAVAGSAFGKLRSTVGTTVGMGRIVGRSSRCVSVSD
jgi:hypothetical protein